MKKDGEAHAIKRLFGGDVVPADTIVISRMRIDV